MYPTVHIGSGDPAPPGLLLRIASEGVCPGWPCEGMDSAEVRPLGSQQFLLCEDRVFLSRGPAGLPSLAATPVLSFSLHPARRLSQSDSSSWSYLQKLPLRPDKGAQNLVQTCRGGRLGRGRGRDEGCRQLWAGVASLALPQNR